MSMTRHVLYTCKASLKIILFTTVSTTKIYLSQYIENYCLASYGLSQLILSSSWIVRFLVFMFIKRYEGLEN